VRVISTGLIEAIRAKTSATLEDDWTVLRLEQLSKWLDLNPIIGT
jgi:hypothetical protein